VDVFRRLGRVGHQHSPLKIRPDHLSHTGSAQLRETSTALDKRARVVKGTVAKIVVKGIT
jgi:hypothetical protein